MRARNSERCAERGVTLLELMVTMGIVAVGILGLTSMNFHSARAVQDAAEIALAGNLASATLDEIQIQDYDLMTAGGVSGFPLFFDKYGRIAIVDTERYFRVDAEVESVVSSEGYKDVLVVVSWNDGQPGRLPTGGDDGHTVRIRGRLRPLAVGL